MLDSICTRKENTKVFLFFKLYKMMLNIFKFERTCVSRELPIWFRPPPIVRERVVSPEAQTLTNGEQFTVLLRSLKHLNVR